MKYTENYNLKKPEAEDFYNVEDFNENADIIDQEVAEVSQALDAHKAETVTHMANVIGYGAIGDGNPNNASLDTAAIKNAILALSQGGEVYLPPGTYMINDTIRIPSNVKLIGAGKDVTILKAVADTIFPTFQPYNNHAYTYKSMIVTDSIDKAGKVEYAGIQSLTIDWNNCPEDDANAVAPVMIGNAKYFNLKSVKFINGLSQDWDGVLYSNYGCNVLYAFAEHCTLDDCEFCECVYECLSVSYLSRNITCKNSIFHPYSPGRHAAQLSRPSVAKDALENEFGTAVPGPLYLINNKTYVTGDSEEGFTSHSGEGFYVIGNYFEVDETAREVWHLTKPFANTKYVTIKDNVYNMLNWNSKQPPSAISLDDSHPREGENGTYFAIITGNIIYLNYPDNDYTTEQIERQPIIGGVSNDNFNIVINNNTFEIREYPNNLNFNVIGLLGNRFSISDNKGVVMNPFGEGDGPNFIYLAKLEKGGKLYKATNGMVTNNSIYSSNFKNGMLVDPEVDYVIIKNNFIGPSENCNGKLYPDDADNIFNEVQIVCDNLGDTTAYIIDTNTMTRAKFWNQNPNNGEYYVRFSNGLEMVFPYNNYSVGDTIPSENITWRRWK